MFLSFACQYLGMIIAPPEYAIGTVYRVDPVAGTCDVDLLNDRGYLPDTPILGTASSDLTNDVETPFGSLLRATVLLMKICAKWYVLTTIPKVTAVPSGLSVSVTNTGTGGDNLTTYARSQSEQETSGDSQGNSSARVFTKGRSVDTISGDKRLAADGGAELLLGKEGLVVLKASTLAQIILGAYKDFARIVAREFELFTDFGTIRFTGGGDEGTPGMAIMGGGHFADEASTIEPSYPVHIFIGDVPWDANGRYAMRVDSPDGSQHMSVEMDTKGNQETSISNALATRSKFRKEVVEDSEEHHILSGGQYVAVGMGADTVPPEDEKDLRDQVESLDAGDRVTDIKHSDTLNIKTGDYTIAVETGNQTTTVAGNITETASGSLTVSADTKIDESTKGNKNLSVDGILNLMLGGLSISGKAGSTSLNMTTSVPLNIVTPAGGGGGGGGI